MACHPTCAGGQHSAFLSARFARIDERVFTPVEASSTFDETLHRLGTAIRLGVLEPGERLPPERELAERLAISRSTLRQVLGVLTGSGHLVALRGRSGGTFVADSPPLSMPVGDELQARYDEIIDCRAMIEVGVAAFLAERATAEQLVAVEEAVEAQRSVGPADAVGYLRADARFHLSLVRAADNPRLERTLTELHAESVNVIIPRIRTGGMPTDLVAHSLEQHRGILAAIRARDVAAATDHMTRHMRNFDERVKATDE